MQENLFKKRILFIGMPDFAIIALSKLNEHKVNIVGVVPPHKSDPTYNIMCDITKDYGYKLIEYNNSLNEIEFLNKIESLNADIGIVCSYNKLLPKDLLNKTKDGFINCHPALLPQYRGGNPYSHVIINNEKETGVTLHFMDEKFDTGNIISQYSIPIEKFETMGTLFNKLSFLFTDMLIETLKKYEQDSKLDSTPQAEGEYIYAPNIRDIKGENIINWNNDVNYIERFIRALNPFIGAITYYKSVGVKIHSAYVKSKKVKYTPGTICELDNHIGVAALDGIVYIKTLQVGSYFIGDALDFIRYINPKKGERFGY